MPARRPSACAPLRLPVAATSLSADYARQNRLSQGSRCGHYKEYVLKGHGQAANQALAGSDIGIGAHRCHGFPPLRAGIGQEHAGPQPPDIGDDPPRAETAFTLSGSMNGTMDVPIHGASAQSQAVAAA